MKRASVYTHTYLLGNFTLRNLSSKENREMEMVYGRGGGDEVLRGMFFRMGDTRTYLRVNENDLKRG